MPGWIKLPRDIDEESFWNTSEPRCKSCAFIDLMLLAAHQDHEIEFDSGRITVKAGEVITSQVKLAKRWGWSRKKVQKFLHFLEKSGHISLKTSSLMTRIKLCKWESYQKGEVKKEQPESSLGAEEEQPKSTINNDKKEENDKKKSEPEILIFVRAKKSYEELTEAEKESALECAKFYEQLLKSKIDFNKLCILVYGSEEDASTSSASRDGSTSLTMKDKQEYGFGDWQTLRKALGCLSREELAYKVLHPYYYIWSLSRQRDYAEKMKKLVEVWAFLIILC